MEIVLHRLSQVTIKPVSEEESDSVVSAMVRNGDSRSRGQEVLMEAQSYYNAMYRFRKERERNKRYAYGDQWSDVICVDGEFMTEEEYIKRQGNVPLKTNLIRRLVKNVIGAYNAQSLEPTCIARDRDEQKIAETMNTILDYNMQLNRMTKMYGSAMEEFLIGGLPIHRKWAGWRNERSDCWTDAVQPNNWFVDNHMRDFRMWDCSCVGEIHDMSFEEMCTQLATTPEDYEWLSKIYDYAKKLRTGDSSWEDFGFDHNTVNSDFLIPKDGTRCRVIEVWRKESKARYRCHDYNTGEVYKIEIGDYPMVYEENQRRMEQAQRAGIPMEEVPFIKCEWFMDNYWYYYFLSPFGDILREGETPYKHKSHPYVFIAYPFIDGEVHSFVGDVIDQQRYTNRLITLNDWVIRASAKGLLMIPEECLNGKSPEEFADEWAKFNGVIVYKPSKNGDVPHQISSNSTNIGVHEMLSLQLKFFEDISGVSSALQGKSSFAGESGEHAQFMAQQAATSLVDLFNSFNEFVREAAYKDVNNIQQFYDKKKIYNIVGESGADIDKISDAEFDFSIVQSQNSQMARSNANQFILSLFNAGAISIEQLLETAKDLPYADALLQSIKAQKEAVEQGQVPEGISPQLAKQVQEGANPEAMGLLQRAMGNTPSVAAEG